MGFFKKDPKRQSIDFDKYELDRLRAHRDKYYYSSLSSLMAHLIDCFCNLDPQVLEHMAAACSRYSEELSEQAVHPDNKFESTHLRLMAQQYHRMELYFTAGQGYVTPRTPTAMQRIDMDKAYLICPDDWIVVNPEDAKRSQFAYAVEVMNHEQFEMPYFIVFSDKDRMDASLENVYTETIKQLDPYYREVLDKTIPLVMDAQGKPLNWSEHMASPWPGFYQIQDAGISHYSYPYGAMVVRPSTKSTKQSRTIE